MNNDNLKHHGVWVFEEKIYLDEKRPHVDHLLMNEVVK